MKTLSIRFNAISSVFYKDGSIYHLINKGYLDLTKSQLIHLLATEFYSWK